MTAVIADATTRAARGAPTPVRTLAAGSQFWRSADTESAGRPSYRVKVGSRGCRAARRSSDLLTRAPLSGAATEGEFDEVHIDDAIPARCLENPALRPLAGARPKEALRFLEALQPGARRRGRVRAHGRTRRPGADEDRARREERSPGDH